VIYLSEEKMDELMGTISKQRRDSHNKMINLLEEYGEFR